MGDYEQLLICNGFSNIRSIDINNTYPDGMPIVIDRVFHAKHDSSMALFRPINLHNFITGLMWFHAQKLRGETIKHLILPFIPGARQDRLNQTGDSLFTLKYIADSINKLNFKTVTVLDPHSEVASALINNIRVINTDECIQAYTAGLKGVISPDGGAEKRAMRVAKKLNIPLYHAWKSRDVGTGKITKFGLEELGEKGRYLVVDDICDGGGTFYGLHDEIVKYSCTADLYVTHGLFTQGTEGLTSKYKKIYCTDSILGVKNNIHVFNICENLLKKGI